MWSLFSRDPTKDFAYEIGEEAAPLFNKSIWSLHNGKKKTSGELVSVFVYQIKRDEEYMLEVARGALKRLKTLRHPNILTYLDSLETDKFVYLVTEYVEVLENHLTGNQYTEEQKSRDIYWGLHQITKGLVFLIFDCNLSYNNLSASSVFVNQAGEWKLGLVEYICPCTDSPPSKYFSELNKYNPPETSSNKSNEKWSRDSWGLGVLIWEVFNGELDKAESLKFLKKVPKALSSSYSELTNVNPRSRISPKDFITKCTSPGGLLRNNFIDTMLFLDEIQIKDAAERNRFFNGLTNQLDDFPPNICKYKILPQLINSFEFGNAGSSVLPPLLKLGKLIEKEEYEKKIVPCVVKLFTSKDRATRAQLLQQVEQFIDFMQPSVVNDQIFPQIAQGFLDTNPAIREQTVKCMLHVAPKLNYRNLNEELMKHFSKLQVKDDEGGIRTNTTVCLGKIASYLHPQIRQKILITAFTRALRDPFSPSRQAGILALSATQHFYTLADCSGRVLPALCSLLVDPDKQIRDQTFKTVKGFVSKLEKYSEDPSLKEEMEAHVNAGNTSNPVDLAASWAGWAVSSLTSKFYKTNQSVTSNKKLESESSVLGKINQEPSQKKEESREKEIPDYTDGWNDQDWGDLEVEETRDDTLKSKAKEKATGDWGAFDSEDKNIDPEEKIDSSEWDSFDVKTDKPASTGNYNWGDSGNKDAEEFFSTLSSNSRPSEKGNIQNRSSKEVKTPIQSGWDCSDQWEGWDKEENKKAKQEEARKKREEKQMKRQKELQEKRMQKSGAMKLGAQRES